MIATDSIEPRWNKRGGTNAKKASEFNESKNQMKWISIFERDVKRLKQITERKERQIYKQKQKKFKLKKWAVLDVACKTNLNSKMGQNCICPNWVPSIACP